MEEKELLNKIRLYRQLLTLAKVPQLLIDFPELIDNQPLKQEEMELVNKWIKDYNKKQQDDLPY